MTETKPIHLSLFETIKVAVSSEESSDVEAVQADEKPDIEAKTPIVEEEARRTEPTKTSPFRSCISFVAGAFRSLPIQYQALSGVLLFGTLWLWSGAGTANNQIAELNQKVDQLNSELAEVKALLKTLVRSIEKDSLRNEL